MSSRVHGHQHEVCLLKIVYGLHNNYGWVPLVLKKCADISDEESLIVSSLRHSPSTSRRGLLYKYNYDVMF